MLILMIILSSVSYGSSYKTFIINDNEVKESEYLTFSVMHEVRQVERIKFTIKQNKEERRFSVKYKEDEETLDRCIKKITKNWRTNIAPESTGEDKWITGFDEDEHKEFKRRLWFRIRRGEKVC